MKAQVKLVPPEPQEPLVELRFLLTKAEAKILQRMGCFRAAIPCAMERHATYPISLKEMTTIKNFLKELHSLEDFL